jgi:hypothetical protein
VVGLKDCLGQPIRSAASPSSALFSRVTAMRNENGEMCASRTKAAGQRVRSTVRTTIVLVQLESDADFSATTGAPGRERERERGADSSSGKLFFLKPTKTVMMMIAATIMLRVGVMMVVKSKGDSCCSAVRSAANSPEMLFKPLLLLLSLSLSLY